jgi:hypothetical protein
VKENKMGEACSMYGKDEKCIKILCEKPDEKSLFRRHRNKSENNIKIDLNEIQNDDIDSFHVAKNRGSVARCCEHGSV